MDLNEIKERVENIRISASDDETAHAAEDRLMYDFIVHVSGTANGDLARMAKEVLKTRFIKFARWCS